MAYVPLRKAMAELGLSNNTLRKYADEGRIPTIRTASGQRRFDVDAYLRRSREPSVVVYARVSSSKQRDDLVRQIERLKRAFPDADVIQDVASGLNFKRKGLRSLLERVLQGDKLKVVVAHKDRLVRFGFDLVAYLVERQGGEVVVLDEPAHQSREGELTADLLAILHHFSCRMHGQRSHSSKANPDLSDAGTKESVQAVARDLAIRLQRDRQVSSEAKGGASGELDGSLEGDSSESA